MPNAGDIIYASDIARLDPAPLVEVSSATNPVTGISSETAFLTLPSTLFSADSAYEVVLEGGFTMSVSTNVPLLTLRKTDASGTIVANFGPRLQAPGTTSATAINSRAAFQVGGSSVTAVLCATVSASAGTVTIVGNSQRQARLRVHYRGASSAWTNLPTLS